jgi:glycosyltransferase involved in cell wall biosynthesis
VVCVYNKKDLLDRYLIKSLKEQSENYELILVDNRTNEYNSAAAALNFGAKNSKGKYIAFIHQDVELTSRNFLKELEVILDGITNLGIAGMAGVSENIPGVISNITQGKSSKLVGITQIKNPIKVQTLDECFIVVPKTVFEILHFDEVTCDDWHLYGVDYSLSVITLGYNAYVLPMSIYHRSPGYSMSKEYDLTYQKLLKKHQNEFKWIYTTLGNYNTKLPFYFQKSAKKFIIPIFKALKLWKYD